MSKKEKSALANAATGFSHLPVTRQIGVLVGLAASVALGVSVVFWAQQPNFRPLYTQLSAKDSAAVTDALSAHGIAYKIDNRFGTVMVPSDLVYSSRMALASDGLPKGDGQGFELLERSTPLGSSQFIEKARYTHALEGELAKTIRNFKNIKNARVHIAMPKKTVFVGDSTKGSASVFVDLYGGMNLSSSQVAAIVHLVASSIPEMNSDNVTVVDQQGNLLTDGNGHDMVSMADKQLKYIHEIEKFYSQKIEDLLIPMVGLGRVNARVSADVDFTQNEETKESFNPDFPAVRSEQTISENKGKTLSASGIPGASSNQPSGETEGGEQSVTGNDSKRQVVKNYELDRTVSHTKQHAGLLKRLSVAVLVDDKMNYDPESGEPTRTPLNAEDIKKINQLVKEAIGFDVRRGDSVSIIHNAFVNPQPVEKLPESKIWQQPIFWDIVKQVVGALFVLLLIFGVIRPTFRSMTNKGIEVKDLLSKELQEAKKAGFLGSEAQRSAKNSENKEQVKLPGELLSYEEQMKAVRQIALDDPKRVAQVVKRWLDSDKA